MAGSADGLREGPDPGVVLTEHLAALKKTGAVFAPDSGAMLLTAEESARYLNYHPVSIRRLVGRGDLHPHSRVGRALLFMREELDRFKFGSAWAAKKSGVERSFTPPIAASAQEGMRAVVVVRVKGKETVFERLKAFQWEDVASIRAKVRSKHGNASFFIAVAPR
jgi:hypothetical protein